MLTAKPLRFRFRLAERDEEQARRARQRGGGGNQGGGGGGNQGGGGGDENLFAPPYERYQPGAYDPNTQFNQPDTGKSAFRTEFGKKQAELDPEAVLARQFGRAGIGYKPNSPFAWDQYVYDQAQNALMGYRAAKLDSPNLTSQRYFNRLPIFRGIGSQQGMAEPGWYPQGGAWDPTYYDPDDMWGSGEAP